jgi:hypothetical protein
MLPHKLRVLFIAIAFLVALIATVVLIALGKDEGTGFGAVVGILSTLAPALMDSLQEQRSRAKALSSEPPVQ